MQGCLMEENGAFNEILSISWMLVSTWRKQRSQIQAKSQLLLFICFNCKTTQHHLYLLATKSCLFYLLNKKGSMENIWGAVSLMPLCCPLLSEYSLPWKWTAFILLTSLLVIHYLYIVSSPFLHTVPDWHSQHFFPSEEIRTKHQVVACTALLCLQT